MDTIELNQIEREVVDALREQAPVRDLPSVSIQDVREPPEQPFDLIFELRSGSNRIQVFGEIRRTFSPKLLEEIAPWIQRLKSLHGDAAVAVIAPMLSPQAQAYCIQNGIDFLDLAGNLFINVPGKFMLQRTGKRTPGISTKESEGQRAVNVFSGRSSRVLRVLLENPKSWKITEIARELSEESRRFSIRFPKAQIGLEISPGSVSKAIASLEEQLWVRRRKTAVIVPEPQRVLAQWGEKYKERYRRRLRSSFQTNNPFGSDIASINRGLQKMKFEAYAFTGPMAASAEAPFVDIDLVDIFIIAGQSRVGFGALGGRPATGPPLRFLYPYDTGVFMYSRRVKRAPVVSPVQAYLDLYACGGRDRKQAEYLLASAIQPRWEARDS